MLKGPWRRGLSLARFLPEEVAARLCLECGAVVTPPPPGPAETPKPKRFHGTVTLDPTRVGRDAGRIADEVISHLAGLVGSNVTVTLEIEAEIKSGSSRQRRAHRDGELPDLEILKPRI